MRYLWPDLSFLLGLSLVREVAAADTCYWPSGNIATPDYIPCPNTSSCCPKGEACLSNGLCYGASLNIAYRGACTDRTWGATSCPDACNDVVPDGWANLYACPDNENQVFTCAGPGWASVTCNDNKSDSGLFSWPSGYVAVAQNALSSSSSSSSISSSATKTPTAGTTSPPASITGSSNSSAVASPSSLTTGAKIGLGVGLGVGIPLLILCGFLFFLLRRERRERQQIQEMQMRQNQYFQRGPMTELPANTVWASTPSTQFPLKSPVHELPPQKLMT
ncbi:hypothetical protein NFIA_058090 [Paecilomyces variotii No. 5]|uniref:Mid2 domain-containing protein n=1 Tax=Byssochlamys spectabilis (strain No. 5 / NBRC 109023) TaxID=1356009 RepID=V5GBF2_BYSSN|nr:hypothetical protein NFIA_058090 [Paecilomyces variotii No. 5]